MASNGSSDSKILKAGKATAGKAWGAVSSQVGDVYEAAAKKNPASSAGRTFRQVSRMLAQTPAQPAPPARSTTKAIERAASVMGGSAMRRREKEEAGL